MTVDTRQPTAPDDVAAINAKMAELGALIQASDNHPTRTARGSSFVTGGGKWVHFSYTRPMTMKEAARTPEDTRPRELPSLLQYQLGYKKTLWQRLGTWLRLP